jgi:hypothetical protein
MAVCNTAAGNLRPFFGKRLALPVRVHIDTRAKIDERQYTLPFDTLRLPRDKVGKIPNVLSGDGLLFHFTSTLPILPRSSSSTLGEPTASRARLLSRPTALTGWTSISVPIGSSAPAIRVS